MTILLCERTIIEAGTGKVSLISTFERFEIPAFPDVSHPCELFLLLVDGIGRYDLVAEIHDLHDDTIVAQTPPFAVEWPERLDRLTVIIPIAPIPFEHGGQYDIVVLGDGQEIDRYKY